MVKENVMKSFKLDKVVLNIGGTDDKLDKGFILLEKLSGKKPVKVKAKKRIPAWSVRPGLEVGCKVTLRGKEAVEMLKRCLPAIDNTLKEKQVQDNFFSFGIEEYIEIPTMEYLRDVGIMGFELSVVFSRAGKSVEKRKVKRNRAKRSLVKKEEIIKFLESNYGTKILEGKK
jgi:large subunit ribosomal protein L5